MSEGMKIVAIVIWKIYEIMTLKTIKEKMIENDRK